MYDITGEESWRRVSTICCGTLLRVRGETPTSWCVTGAFAFPNYYDSSYSLRNGSPNHQGITDFEIAYIINEWVYRSRN